MAKIKNIEGCFEEVKDDSKTTKTAFILMFPALIIAAIASMYSPLAMSVIVVALAVYQFLMLKQFIEDFYRGR